MILNKKQIAAADDLPSKLINIEEWGGEVKIRVMSLKERLELEKYYQDNPKENSLLKWVMLCCVNEDNTQMFDNDDLEMLMTKNPDVILKIYEEIKILSNIGHQSVDELAKNS